MIITKAHKLYFKATDGSTRRLDKASFKIYLFVIEYFRKKGGTAKYQEHNKDVKKWQDYKEITLPLPEQYHEELKKITKEKGLLIYYNSSWKPLVQIYHL